MRRTFISMLVLVWPILGRAGEPGFLRTSFTSKLLGRAVPLGLHVPDEATVAQWHRAHPHDRLRLVLFLPGGYDGPEDVETSGLHKDLRHLETTGQAAPSLWVAVTHFKSWYADRQDGTFPYERFLMEELLPEMERRYPGYGGSPRARTVAGLSMGGLGALNLAARTKAFDRCAALSPALIRPPFNKADFFMRRALRKAFPMDAEAFAPWDPWRHLGGQAELMLGCGTEDKYRLHEVAQAFANHCKEEGRALTFTLAPGGHDWVYWRSAFAQLAPRIAQPSGEKDDRINATDARAQ